MITLRPSNERGHNNHGWLDTHFSFSFSDYYDPRFMGFRSLRVINEDRVEPGMGFGMHPHRDMEIVTYVLEGALEHKDSIGGGGVIRPGDVQRMSAGTGIFHSEFNPSPSESVHLLQIWILPDRTGIAPSYEQKRIPDEERRGRLRLIASNDGRDGAVTINQDASIYSAMLSKGDRVTHPLAPGRAAWAQIARGEVAFNNTTMRAGDGAAISDEEMLEITASSDAELLLFDLA